MLLLQVNRDEHAGDGAVAAGCVGESFPSRSRCLHLVRRELQLELGVLLKEENGVIPGGCGVDSRWGFLVWNMVE